MDLTSPKTIQEILEKNMAKPSHGLGQNFLIDRNILNKIILAANLNKNNVVLEVGPGIGTLTYELAKNCSMVICIEKDDKMINILKETLKDVKNVKVFKNDILQTLNYSNKEILPDKNTKYKVVANIPYYITGPLIRGFLEIENKPEEIILMVQKEVAQRICQNPPYMSLFAVSVQYYAKSEIISFVSKNCFLPAPNVDSAIIKIIPHSKINEGRNNEGCNSDKFFKVVKAGFSQKRKQLINNFILSLKMTRPNAESWLLKNNIEPTRRAQTLSIEEWQKLANNLPDDT